VKWRVSGNVRSTRVRPQRQKLDHIASAPTRSGRDVQGRVARAICRVHVNVPNDHWETPWTNVTRCRQKHSYHISTVLQNGGKNVKPPRIEHAAYQ
jgi:hypothetical protein